MNTNNFDLTNLNMNELFPALIATLSITLITLYCFSGNKTKTIDTIITIDTNIEKESELSDETSSVEEKDCSLDSSEEQYTSILYKSFLLMSKKQLLRITGIKYKNFNKDELIIIAMNKFIVSSIDNFKLMPIDAKNFVKENQETMKEEFFKLYNVKSKEYNNDFFEDSASEELHFNA